MEDDGTIYAGCYVNAIISLWAQDNTYGKRINAQLEGVQFCNNGEPLGAGGIDVDEFDAFASEDVRLGVLNCFNLSPVSNGRGFYGGTPQ